MLHAAADGGIASSTSQALAVLRRMFARPGAVQLLFAEGMLSRPSRLAGFMGEHEAQVRCALASLTLPGSRRMQFLERLAGERIRAHQYMLCRWTMSHKRCKGSSMSCIHLLIPKIAVQRGGAHRPACIDIVVQRILPLSLSTVVMCVTAGSTYGEHGHTHSGPAQARADCSLPGLQRPGDIPVLARMHYTHSLQLVSEKC